MSLPFAVRPATPADDRLIAQHFYQLWRDNNVAKANIAPNWAEITQQFIDRARQTLDYAAFLASVDGEVVGSVGCQLFSGLYPLLLADAERKYGYIWGVYVEKDYRSQGIATALTERAIDHLKILGCTRVILHSSPSGRFVYDRLGFIDSNEMRLDLQ